MALRWSLFHAMTWWVGRAGILYWWVSAGAQSAGNRVKEAAEERSVGLLPPSNVLVLGTDRLPPAASRFIGAPSGRYDPSLCPELLRACIYASVQPIASFHSFSSTLCVIFSVLE